MACEDAFALAIEKADTMRGCTINVTRSTRLLTAEQQETESRTRVRNEMRLDSGGCA